MEKDTDKGYRFYVKPGDYLISYVYKLKKVQGHKGYGSLKHTVFKSNDVSYKEFIKATEDHIKEDTKSDGREVDSMVILSINRVAY